MQFRFTPFPKMETNRLVLRKLQETDQESIFKLRTEAAINKFIQRVPPANIGEALAFIKKINAGIDEGKIVYWAICLKQDLELIGAICLWNFADDFTEAEIGYELHVAYQGKGIMDEAMKKIILYACENIKVKRIEAFTELNNLNSINLLKKNNFHLDAGKIDEDNLKNGIYFLQI